MAVFDFSVEITRFGTSERARPLVRLIAETLDCLGIDHLLVDLNRDGDAAWVDAYQTDPIVVTGSTRFTGLLEERVLAGARELLPGARVAVRWRGHDPGRAAVAQVNREIERVARAFSGIGRGAVPARVRFAILDTDGYLARFGSAHADDERARPAELTLNALYQALSEVGAHVGIDWKSADVTAAGALRGLRVLPAAYGERGGSADDPGSLDRWIAAEETELSIAEPIDEFAAETANHLHAAMFDAIRDSLSFVSDEEAIAGLAASDGGMPAQEWLAELVTSSPGILASRGQVFEPIEG